MTFSLLTKILTSGKTYVYIISYRHAGIKDGLCEQSLELTPSNSELKGG
jgi:hypothetical protein